MDTVLCETYVEPMMKVALTILRYSAHDLLGMGDMEVMVEFLKQRLPNAPHEDLQVRCVCGGGGCRCGCSV